MTLAETQQQIARWLAGGREDVSPLVTPRAHRGLAVYRHAYGATLLTTLRDTFEKTHAWLGDDAFDEAARDHIALCPPSSWTLADYGAGFVGALVHRYPDDIEVSELAWLDWSLRRAFDGPDAIPLDPTALTSVDWDTVRFELVPTMTVARIETNAPAIWSAIAAGVTPPSAERIDGAASLLVWRNALDPRFRTIDAIEADALARLAAGETFATVCAAIATHSLAENAAERAGILLGQWIADGILCGVRR